MTFRPNRVVSPEREELRARALQKSLYARAPVATAPPLINMPVESVGIVNLPVTGFVVDKVYVKKITRPVQDMDVSMIIASMSGITTPRLALGIYRIDAVPSIKYGGLLATKLVKVWSYITQHNAASPTNGVTVLLSPPVGLKTYKPNAPVYEGPRVILSSRSDYAVAVAHSTAFTAGNMYTQTDDPTAAVSPGVYPSVSTVAMAAGWADLPNEIDEFSLSLNQTNKMPMIEIYSTNAVIPAFR